MCFGSEQQSTTNSSQTVTPPSWLSDAANSNLQFAKTIQDKGFTPYNGQQVADFAPQQSQSFNLGGDVAGGVSPYVGETGGLVDSYAKAGPQSVSADTIASKMSPYMSAYVGDSLVPQLQAQDLQFANQNKAVDSAATMGGAFGDTGWGQMRGTTTQAQDAARTGLVANAYNTAFNTAIGAGAQDSANDLNAKTTNANLAETALGRQLTGANTLYQMGTGATGLENTLGGQQTAQKQAGLNADYNQWQMGLQYPFQTTQLMDQAIAAGRAGAPITTTGSSTSETPDNSGYGILGSIAGSALRFVADGGPVEDGQFAVVGERGPELIKLGGDGVVIPNEVLQAAGMLRNAKVANGEGDPKSSLKAALQKPVRYMADGGFFGDDGFMSGAGSLDSGNGAAWQNPDQNSNVVAFPQPTAAPGATPAGQNPSAPNATDAKWKQFAADVGAGKTWAPLGRPAVAAQPHPTGMPQAPQQTPMPQMAPISLPGGGSSQIPQNMTTAPGAPPTLKFGIAA